MVEQAETHRVRQVPDSETTAADFEMPRLRSTFVLDINGLIERVPPEDSVLFINLAGGSSPTQLVFTADQATVEDGTPDFVRIKDCIDPTTNILTLVADGRSDILSCDGFAYLSSGDGTDVSLDCSILMALTTDI